MTLYRYQVRDQNSKSIVGNAEAANERELVATLRNRGFVILSLTEQRKKGFLTSGKGGRVRADDLVVFSRQLATMVDAGLPLLQSLNILNEQMVNPAFKAIGREMEKDIAAGATLSDALSKHQRVFSPLFINLVRAGEASGTLDEILNRVATYLEESEALRRKIKSALVYPTVVSIIAISITLFLIIFVIPRFQEIFTGLGAKLPLPTLLLLGFSDWMRRYFLFIAAGMVVFFIGFRFCLKGEKARLKFDRFKLRAPVFGVLFRKVAISKFTRTLCTLIKSGVPILNALEIVGKTAGNKVVEEAVEKVRLSIRGGESIAEPLTESGVFPPMVVRMIAVGEQTGSLEKMLGKVSDFYDDQVNAAVSGLTSMIEPLIIAFLGIVIGGIVIAMFLPVFKVTELVK